ncbi:MAG TPA: spore coat protein [Clostridia bacterium]|jgi:spore coat protein CotF|nr:spore coat protein [Clostridia bacterium]
MKTQLNDIQIIQDVLSGEKSLANMYNHAILESSCPKMRKVLGGVHGDVTQNQYQCFEYMSQNNLYPVEYADSAKLTEAINKFAQI